MALTPEQNLRYARQILLPGIGGSGQEKLLNTNVLVIGAGGLGSPLLQYLIAGGVGAVTIADDDTVALSNLQRQVLYTSDEIGQPKAQKAAERLNAINPECQITALQQRITSTNVDTLVPSHDIIVDCCDSFGSRFTISDACVRHGKPMISAAVQGFDGMVAVFDPANGGPCYRCFNPSQPPRDASARTCEEVGVLGAMAGVVGAWQSLTVIKYILGLGTLNGSLNIFNGMTGQNRVTHIPCDPECSCQKS